MKKLLVFLAFNAVLFALSAQGEAELLGDLTKITKKPAGPEAKAEPDTAAAPEAAPSESESAKDDIRSKFSAKDLNALTPDILAKSRASRYSARPKVSDFNFEDVKAVENYLASITDENMKKREKARVNYLSSIRPGVIHSMGRTPYTGPVKLKNATVRGPIANSNENGFFIVTGTKKKPRTKTYKWSDASPELIVLMMAQYTAQRMRLAPTKEMTEADIKSESAKQYLATAIFCDWYGLYDDAVKYARKAVQTDKSRTKTAEILFLD